MPWQAPVRSEEHTSELQSQFHLVCRLLLEKKKRARGRCHSRNKRGGRRSHRHPRWLYDRLRRPRALLRHPLLSRRLNDLFFFFFFNDTATTEIYTLSLHDALPI